MKLKVVLNQENLGDLDVPKEEIMEEEGAGRPGNEGNLSLATLPISEDPPAPSPVSSIAFLCFISIFVVLGV